MQMDTAPLHAHIAHGPDGGKAFWIPARDGVRLRIGHWPSAAKKGTVLLFPGRTEYIEKYGKTATDLTDQGLDVITIDWRGQGLADRLLSDPRTGHVGAFGDYQMDVAAMVEAAEKLALPKPWYLLGHSMGGCIGLRSLMDGLPVKAAAFTGPMWGIRISTFMRPAAWVISWGSGLVGLDHNIAPGTKPTSYIASEPFEDNMLTTDPDMFEYMRKQLVAEPGFQLGGPSLRWLHEALIETHTLAHRPAPNVPCVTWLGSNERIVDIPRIEQRMQSWPNGTLRVVEGREHEVLMDDLPTRKNIIREMVSFFLSAETEQMQSALSA